MSKDQTRNSIMSWADRKRFRISAVRYEEERRLGTSINSNHSSASRCTGTKQCLIDRVYQNDLKCELIVEPKEHSQSTYSDSTWIILGSSTHGSIWKITSVQFSWDCYTLVPSPNSGQTVQQITWCTAINRLVPWSPSTDSSINCPDCPRLAGPTWWNT